MKVKNFVPNLMDGVDVIKKPAFTNAACGVCFVALLASMKVP